MIDYIIGCIVGVVVTSFIMASECSAQTTYYSNNYGQLMGVANTVGYQTYYSNSYGQLMGVATTIPTFNPPPVVPPSTPPKGIIVEVAPMMPLIQMMPMLGAAR